MMLAAVALAAAAAPVAHASPNRTTAPRIELRGTVSPLVAKGIAHVVGTPRAKKQVMAVVAFKPRNAILLQWLAEHSSGRPGMSNAEIDRLFAPRPKTVAAVRSYLNANGLSVVDATDMSLVVAGTAAEANRAFGVGLRLYRDARGFTYQAPSANVRLPRGIASVVESVDGLDTSLRLHSHYNIVKHAKPASGFHPKLVPHSVTGCTTAHNKQANPNNPQGYLPGDLAGAGAYNHDALISAGDDGSTQRIGFVEFSGYHRSDANGVNGFKNCFTGITGTLEPDVAVGGGPTDNSGQVEVTLDIEVAMGAAPGAHWRVYKAPNSLAFGPVILNRIRNDDDVDIVSDSWGLCEFIVPVKLTSVENTALALLAINGTSFYVASGDDGAADCRAAEPNAKFVAIDDPSGQPFATSVGGTSLRAPPFGGFHQKAWRGSGGGISINWPRPQYQQSTSMPFSTGNFCLSGVELCRATPDIAGSTPIWGVVGGTSAAAPLAAGITADSNESAGQNLGFANPFIYDGTNAFSDVITGNNVNFTGTAYQARNGYDFVTGRGSIVADQFASDLATFVVTQPVWEQTKLTGTHPLNRKRVNRGSIVTFAGKLTNIDTPGPIAHRQIIVIGNSRIIAITHSTADGTWEARAKIKKRTTWHAIFMGSDLEMPDLSPNRLIRIRH
jgi:kumamolisin